jgi:TonB family protein
MFGHHGPPAAQSPRSRSVAIGSSVLTHSVLGVLALWLSTLPRTSATSDQVRPTRYNLIWIASPGPGGGGGGGGNRTKAAAAARQVGRDRLTVPTVGSLPTPTNTPKEPPRLQPLTIPAKPLADASEVVPGVVAPSPSSEITQGPGIGGGAGTGTGTGSGEGEGSGLGPGFGGGTGGGAYRPGSGVSMPQLVREVKPDYTADAMRAKVQGAVLLECVVLTDGTIGDVRIVKSLDNVFGLDEQAVKAARQWRFQPGRRFGEPVPVIVLIELTFTLR